MHIDDFELKTSVDWIKNYDGKPSVTWILSLIVDPTFDMLKSNPDFERIMKAAADRWTYVHNYIENTLQNKLTYIDDQYKDFIKQVILYKNIYPTQWKLYLEKFFSTNDLWWTIDCIEETKTFTIIRDWKTAKQLPSWLMLDKYKLQLGAYYYLYINSWNVSHQMIQAELVVFTEDKFRVFKYNEIELAKFADIYLKILDTYYSIIKEQW